MQFNPLSPTTLQQKAQAQAPQGKKATRRNQAIQSIKLLEERSFRMYVYTERFPSMHACNPQKFKDQIPDMPIPTHPVRIKLH
jgi:hypothetical protein